MLTSATDHFMTQGGLSTKPQATAPLSGFVSAKAEAVACVLFLCDEKADVTDPSGSTLYVPLNGTD